MAPVRSRTSQPRPPRLHCSHYRGYALEQQKDLSWTVSPLGEQGSRPGFTAPPSSLADMRALIDWRLGLLPA